MSSPQSLPRVLPFLAFLGGYAATPAGLAATPWPPAALTAEVLTGVGQFAITRSQTGRLSLVYCGQDCTTIHYRVLAESGTWSAPETVNTGTGPQTADLAIDLDPSGIPHVFWGQDSVVLHAVRQSSGDWSQSFALPDDSYGRGRLNAAQIRADGRLHLLTTYDYSVWGGYVFSDLAYAYGSVDGTLSTEWIVLDGEYGWDLDLALDTNGQPVFAVAQQYFGGSFAPKLVYNDGSQWQARELDRKWGLCVRPIQIAVGATIHLNSCGGYTRLSNPTADVNWITSWRDDMTIDENDVPYFVAASAGNVTLGTIAADASRASLAVETPPSSCPGGTCPSFTSSRILYDRGQVLVAYLGDDLGLRVKGYRMDALRCHFAGLAALTVTAAGSGSGTVGREPAGTACGTDTWGYPAGTSVTLKPVAGTDATFRTWTGDCADSTGACTLTLEAGVRFETTAEFTWFPNELQHFPPWRHLRGQ